MTQAQLDLMKELNQAIEPIVKKYLEEGKLDIADVVYCSMVEAETIALATKRRMVRENGKEIKKESPKEDPEAQWDRYYLNV